MSNRLKVAMIDVVLSLHRKVISQEIVIIHGGFPGVDACVANACQENKWQYELYLADYIHARDYRYQNREELRRGADVCVIFHQGEMEPWCKDLVAQATEARVPTYLIADKKGRPRRIISNEAPPQTDEM
jgi:hypothetical protein